MRLALGGLAALTVLAAACGSSARAHDSGIVLERSIGPVALREPRTKVEKVVGKGTTIRNDENHGHQISYPKAGVTVVYAPGPRDREAVFAILTTSSRYRTRGGVGVGSSKADVVAIGGIQCFSSAACQHGAAYRKPGTAFFLRDGKIWRIAIVADFD